MSRTITAIYDSETDARQARDQLVSTGIEDDDVKIVSHGLSRTDAGSDGDHRGIWESIKDFFVGDEDRPVYSEGLRRGGYLLTARVDDDRSDEAIRVLEDTNAVDLDRRSEEWRSQGWSDSETSIQPSSMSGYAAGAGPTTDTIDSQLRRDTMEDDNDASDIGISDVGASQRELGLRANADEQSIPIVEERLRVGKREVNRGGVRVRSYVVEEPVHEQVNLRQERVEVQRRPASGSTAIGDAAFEDRTIELDERAEEAVVAKDAVVTEEVVVRKAVDERTENIDDTVRRTEVDIDDTTGRSSGRTRGKSGNSRSGARKRT